MPNLFSVSRLLALALVLAVVPPAAATDQPPSAPDAAGWLTAANVRPAQYSGVTKSSRYVAGADGVRLAVDVYLPDGVAPGARLPAIIEQTRYYRSTASGADPVAACKAVPPFIDYFVRRGYAFVVVDVRGTGASFGSRSGEFTRAEVRDGGAVVDWIVAQPWSNGRVGATGVSYVGTTAELLLVNHHRAVKAVAPISAGYDFYSDINFPGGVANIFFNRGWGRINHLLDSADAAALQQLGVGAGPCPVDSDRDGAELKAAIAEHAANPDGVAILAKASFRDDTDPSQPEGWPSAYRQRGEIDAARTPLLSIVGWADAGYAAGGIHRFMNSRSGVQRLIIAPANHGLRFYYAPGITKPTPSSFDLKGEVLRFFDRYVATIGSGYEREPRLRWFTTGADRWNAATTWPAAARALDLCLAPSRRLDRSCRGLTAQTENFTPQNDARTGAQTRWETSLGGRPVTYPDRRDADAGLLTYTGAPLDRPLEFTGSPTLAMTIRNTVPDSAYFVYLEDVAPDGAAYYVTEGVLRASHSKPGPAPYRTIGASRSDLRRDGLGDLTGRALRLVVPLLPTSHRFLPGHRVRIAIAASDAAHFDSPPVAGQQWSITLGGAQPARLSLPQPR